MPYGSDKVGYGNCVPSEEENKSHRIEVEKIERLINIKNKPPNHRSEEEKALLRESYGF